MTLLITFMSFLFSIPFFVLLILFRVSRSFIISIYIIQVLYIWFMQYVYIYIWKIAVVKPVCILLHRPLKPSWSPPICDRARRYSSPLAPKEWETWTKVTFLFGKHESSCIQREPQQAPSCCRFFLLHMKCLHWFGGPFEETHKTNTRFV